MSHSPTSSSVVTLGCAMSQYYLSKYLEYWKIIFFCQKIFLGVPHGGSTLKVVEFQRFQNSMLSVV